MRTALAVALACLLVLAGCGTGGPGGSGPVASTVTPAPVPDGATPTSDRSQRLAPGLTAEGVVAPTALVGAHTAALRGQSFTTLRGAVTYAEDGRFRSEVSTRGLVSADRRQLLVDRRATGPLVRQVGLAGRTEQYIAGTTTVRREVRNDTVRYSSGPRDAGIVTGSVLLSDLTAGSTLALALHAMNFSVAPVEGESKTTQYRLVSTEITDPDALVGLAGENARNVTFDATATPQGLVTWFRLSYTADRGESSVTVVRTVRFLEVGTTTVDRPSWYSNATNGSPTAPAVREPLLGVSLAPSPTVSGVYASGVRSTTVPS
ncbi:hypothetical protein ACFPYI_09990 [Halomarina salina]|uniref:Outer membrane lipoprotein-sorting protein n=1 Tax=Halomarina salina TaxID=1872699 RepID=A0ABD5RMA1_9EURY|nr:hypothetical protein [Halomarina salina]